MSHALPIDELLPTLCESLQRANCLVLKAPPGAGKTTRIPPALLDAGLLGNGDLIVLEPRRIAARSAATRIATERGERVGQTIGYRVRFDERVSRQTRIVVMTEGIFLRRLQQDPFLEGTAAVIFDEFHERRLDSDLALAMAHRVQQTVRADLKLVVMSATLDPEPIAAYLGGCSTLESPGREYPVTVRYVGRLLKQQLAEPVTNAILDCLPKSSGDILVFLPGVGEIRQTQQELERRGPRDILVMPLFGDLPVEEQDRVLAPATFRKVILSTNVAETSVTIEGVTTVIDSGLARTIQFDPEIGLDRLELSAISKASADQRAGRAGRTQPGTCLRLWDEVSQRHRPEYELPEVKCVDISGAMLQLRAWGETDLRSFPWYERPGDTTIDHAERLLQRLGALDGDKITTCGKMMVQLPVQPRLARLIVTGQEFGHTSLLCLLAAYLSERDPFFEPERRPVNLGRREASAVHRTSSDVTDRLFALREFLDGGRKEFSFGVVNVGAARNIAKVTQQLERRMSEVVAVAQSPGTQCDAETAVSRALLAAFPDRLARRREPGSQRGLMVGGKGVKLGPQSAVTNAELFLCINVDGAGTEATVRQASAVEFEWLPPNLLRKTEDLFLHPSSKQVVARRRLYWDDLILDEQPCELTDHAAAADVLFSAAISRWDQVFPSDNPAVLGLLNRVRCLSEWLPEQAFPTFSEDDLQGIVRDLCHSCRSIGELKKADWRSLLLSRLTYEQQQTLEREAPENLLVPSGSHIALTYEVGRPPVLAVRIQEVFGMQSTPRIAGGRVPVLLHLLAPNMRPQQITSDLASFWAHTYAEVRKELRRRYPKHAWPEDPTQAPPQRRPGGKPLDGKK